MLLNRMIGFLKIYFLFKNNTRDIFMPVLAAIHYFLHNESLYPQIIFHKFTKNQEYESLYTTHAQGRSAER